MAATNSARSSLRACIALALFICSDAFAPSSFAPIRTPLLLHATANESLQLTTNPTPSQIATLATTPSRTESKAGTWSETVSADATYTRYIVEGEGSLAFTSANGETTRRRITPGSLVEVTGGGDGESQLVWDVDDKMTIMYSGEMFDEQQMVAIGLLGLLAVVGGVAYYGTMNV